MPDHESLLDGASEAARLRGGCPRTTHVVGEMSSPTETFFAELAAREHVPWLEHERGALRFEVVDGEWVREWTVAFDNGAVQVTRTEADVDAVMRIDRALFDRVVGGEANLLSAWLRGEVTYAGSLELLTQVGRLVPGPPDQIGAVKVRAGGKSTG
jgi:SCP-2 sterol transfer family